MATKGKTTEKTASVKPSQLNRQQLERFISSWQKNETLLDVCKVTGYSYIESRSIARYLREKGIPLKSFQGKKPALTRDDFNELKAYFDEVSGSVTDDKQLPLPGVEE
jgi:hypothetical protein